MRHSYGGPPTGRRWRRLGLAVALVAAVGTATIVAVASATTTSRSATVKVGLITKDATNPFFVKMHAGAKRRRASSALS